jgi:hypothetical protein
VQLLQKPGDHQPSGLGLLQFHHIPSSGRVPPEAGCDQTQKRNAEKEAAFTFETGFSDQFPECAVRKSRQILDRYGNERSESSQEMPAAAIGEQVRTGGRRKLPKECRPVTPSEVLPQDAGNVRDPTPVSELASNCGTVQDSATVVLSRSCFRSGCSKPPSVHKGRLHDGHAFHWKSASDHRRGD